MKHLFFFICMFSVVVWADAVSVSVVSVSTPSDPTPHLDIKINEPILGFKVNLKRSDGKVVDVKGGGPPGVTRTLYLEQPKGSFKWSGELTVDFKGGAKDTLPLEFETKSGASPFSISVNENDVFLDEGRLRFRTSHPVVKAEFSVLMPSGTFVVDGTFDVNPTSDGSYELTWPVKNKERPIRIALKVIDADEMFSAKELFPWYVEIPHQDVVFDTGKANILSKENPKVEAAYFELEKQLIKFGEWAKFNLYIVGHTDSVGDRAYNQKLSLDRARSLAIAFRRKGVKLEIYYDGFGEDAPAVPTADETAEEKNRRAEYLLSVIHPKWKNPVPKWKKL